MRLRMAAEAARLSEGEEPSDVAEAVDEPAVSGTDSEATESADGPLAPEMRQLRDKVRRVLATYYRTWKLNTRDHNPWEVMHAVIAYGVHTEVLRDGPQGAPVNAIGWLCYNGVSSGERILTLERGRIAARKGPRVQGHHGQLLAILAQSRLMSDYPMRVEGRDFKLADLIESEMLGCQSGTELTFKLIALMHYLESDTTWRNAAGEEWSIPRLIREEISQPIRGAACGGTHRLMGLSYAVQKRRLRGEPIDGEFFRAQKYTDEYHLYTFGLQNSDGSFSTEWFARKGARPDVDRRVQTTGHILEWLAFSLPDEMLADRRTVQAVDYLAGLLLEGSNRRWEIGPLGHALHALALYDERMFKSPVNQNPAALTAVGAATPQRLPADIAARPVPAAARSADRPAEVGGAAVAAGPSLGAP